MSREDELRDQIDETARAIAGLESNPRPWLAWVVYLLNNLEQEATSVDPGHQQAYTDMLRGLQDAIRTRLTTGGW
jgi:hypothetical protein